MKIEQLQVLQPQLFERFAQIVREERLSHAYLFSGALGSFDMALMLSQSLFCDSKQAGLPCQDCRTCRLIDQQAFSDVTVLTPQGNLIKTETVRDLVKQFSQSGFEASRQVFIIRDAEKMHANAANALLKSMEEPDSDIVLFLLTNQIEAVLPTIKSRAQLVEFPANPTYVQHQVERMGLLKSQARVIAQLAADMEEAQFLASQSSFLELIASSQGFVDQLLQRPEQAYLQVSSLISLVSEKAEQARLFALLTLQAREELLTLAGQRLLQDLLTAQVMWRSNVSLQNTLEYLALRRISH